MRTREDRQVRDILAVSQVKLEIFLPRSSELLKFLQMILVCHPCDLKSLIARARGDYVPGFFIRRLQAGCALKHDCVSAYRTTPSITIRKAQCLLFFVQFVRFRALFARYPLCFSAYAYFLRTFQNCTQLFVCNSEAESTIFD